MRVFFAWYLDKTFLREIFSILKIQNKVIYETELKWQRKRKKCHLIKEKSEKYFEKSGFIKLWEIEKK